MESGFGLYLIEGVVGEELLEDWKEGKAECIGEVVTVGRGEVDRGEEGEVDRVDWLTGLLPAKPK